MSCRPAPPDSAARRSPSHAPDSSRRASRRATSARLRPRAPARPPDATAAAPARRNPGSRADHTIMVKDSLAVIAPSETAIGHSSVTARRLVNASLSDNTRRAYAGALGQLDAWLDGLRLDDAALAAYLAELHDGGRAASSAAMAVAAARFRARLSGQADPAGERTTRVLAGYRRTAGDRARGQARPFTAEDLAAVLATCHLPRRRGRGLKWPSTARGSGIRATARRSTRCSPPGASIKSGDRAQPRSGIAAARSPATPWVRAHHCRPGCGWRASERTARPDRPLRQSVTGGVGPPVRAFPGGSAPSRPSGGGGARTDPIGRRPPPLGCAPYGPTQLRPLHEAYSSAPPPSP